MLTKCSLNLSFKSVLNKQIRYLFTKSTLGMDEFISEKMRIQSQFRGRKEQFKEKMTNFCAVESRNMIFTEDLKRMIYITDCERDRILFEEMLKTYCEETERTQFGRPGFVFGPVIMRMFHLLKKPRNALEIYKCKTFTDLFNQLTSHVILMDMLFNCGMYLEVLDVHETMREKKLPDNHQTPIMILVFAACYKLNTNEAFDYMQKLWLESSEIGGDPHIRTIYYAAALSLHQNHPHMALEIISCGLEQDDICLKSLRILSLLLLNREEEALSIMKCIPDIDCYYKTDKGKICLDVIHKVKSVILKSNNEELAIEFDNIVRNLEDHRMIAYSTLDSYLLTKFDFTSSVTQHSFCISGTKVVCRSPINITT